MKFKFFISIFLYFLPAIIQQFTYAGMSPLTFKNVSKCFNDGYQYYNPILGSAALSTGIIENLRFYNIEVALKADGRPEHIKDTPLNDDPIMTVVKILFPSPAGQLTTETSTSSNFGRYCKPPHVAELLNFAHVIRKFCANEKNKFQNNKITTILKAIQQTTSIDKIFTNEFKQTEKNGLLVAITQAILSELRPAKESFKPAFYPNFCIEQIITAFFCLKFSDQEALKELLVNLSNEIVDQANINAVAGDLKAEDVQPALDRLTNQKADLDDLWIIINRDIFTRILPYQNGKNPISSGLANRYKRITNKLSETSPFSDCVEVTLRHIINIMLYNALNNSFNLAHLGNHMADKNNPFFKNFTDFYNLQKPAQANAGDSVIRSAWNKVIADLGNNVKYCKKFDDKDSENNNELESGMINMLRVFKTLFSLDFDQEPIYTDDQKASFKNTLEAWITSNLEKTFKFLNSSFLYEITLKDCHYEQEKNDLFGLIIIQVKDKNNNPLFSFTVSVLIGHTEMHSMKITEKNVVTLDEKAIQSIKTNLTTLTETTLPSLLFIGNLLKPDNQIANFAPLYQLLVNEIKDGESMINALETFIKLHLGSTLLIEKNRADNILKNILLNFPWSDSVIARKVMLAIINIKNLKRGYDAILTNYTRGIALSNDTLVSSLTNFFPNLEYLYLDASIKKIDLSDCTKIKKINVSYHDSNLESITFPEHMDNLEELNLFKAKIKILTLPACPNLKTLTLRLTTELSEVIFSGPMNNLIELDLNHPSIKILTLSSCPNLKNLDLSSAKQLSSITFTGPMDNLEELSLSNTSIENLALPDCSNLKILRLGSTSKLSTVIFPERMDRLEGLYINHSSIKKLTLPACPNLKVFRLNSNTPFSLSEATLVTFPKRMDSLQELHLDFSLIESLILPACPKLKMINLEQTRQLKTVTFANYMDNLEKLSLVNSAVKKIIGIENCPKLDRSTIPSHIQLIENPMLNQYLLKLKDRLTNLNNNLRVLKMRLHTLQAALNMK